MQKISIVTPCYNEEENIAALHESISDILSKFRDYDYEHIFIDNCSTDNSQQILRTIASEDKRVKVILNARNFGHIRSPYHATIQATGDAVIYLASDFQDPPDLIPQLITKWQEGAKIVLAIKTKSHESPLLYRIRTAYYRLASSISDIRLNENNTGFGLYDKQVIEILRKIEDPYPYFRGLISEIGFAPVMIPFTQPKRLRGITKNNFFTLYDIAMLGITKHSKVPLRLASILGFGLSVLSLLVSICYFIYKLLYWERFSVGMAPVVVGLFLFCSVQLFFIGILGEYIGVILTHVRKLPLVVEKERINF